MGSTQGGNAPAAASIMSVLLLAVVIGAGGLTAQLTDDPQASARVSPEDLFRIADVTELDFHPEGQRLAFVVSRMDRTSNEYRRAIWEASLTTGDLRQLTWGDSDQSPQWSPNGEWLAFQSSRSGSPQVWLLPTRGGEARQITEFDSGISALTWGPDSRRLAVVSEVEGPAGADRLLGESVESEAGDVMVMDRLRYRAGTSYLGSSYPHVFVVSIGGGDPVQVTDGPYEDSDPAWSPTGQRIAFVSNRTNEPDFNRNTDIWIVEASGGEADWFSGGPGTDVMPRWSADGAWLAFQGNADPHDYGSQNQVWAVGAAGGEPRNVTNEVDHTPARFEWAPGGRLAVSFMIRGNVEIHTLNLSGEHHAVVAGKGRAEDLQEELTDAFATAYHELADEQFAERMDALVEAEEITAGQRDIADDWFADRPTDAGFFAYIAVGTADADRLTEILDRAVEKELLTQDEADAISAWHGERPDFLPEHGMGHDRDGERRHGGRGHVRDGDGDRSPAVLIPATINEAS